MYKILNMKSDMTTIDGPPPRQMAYREKLAWLSLVAIAVAFIPYFTIVAMRAQYQAAVLPQLGLYAAAACVQVLVLVAGRWILRQQSPQDAAIPPDERDVAISQRGITAAYYVLIAGTIVAGCIMPFSNHGFTIVNAAFAAIILAEVVHYAVAAAGYRRLA
jgi:cytochrome b561